MGGICGIALSETKARVHHDAFEPMLRAQGESRQGEVWEGYETSVSLGAQRLASWQFGIARETVSGRARAVAFVGSIYNWDSLFSKGWRELEPAQRLLSLYHREGGIRFIQLLRGEFAIAVWDGIEQALYLATDRFRVCPLFYARDKDKLIFASRMKTVVAASSSSSYTVRPEAVVDVIAGSCIPTPRTIFREVEKLPPASVLTYQNGKIELNSYWDITFTNPDHSGEASLASRLREQFRDAMAIRLEEDKAGQAMGCFLSGGIDSSTITGVMTQLTERPVKTFSIGFGEERFNEINYARIAAKAFNTEHHEYFVKPKDVVDTIPALMEYCDEPFANASAIPTYMCAKLAREHGVQVLYAGDGGDELFAGNERYATQRLFDYYHDIPQWCRELFVKPMAFGLADALGWSVFIKAKKYIQRATIPYPERLYSYGLFKMISMNEVFEDGLLEAVGHNYNPYMAIDYHYWQARAQTELDRQLYVDLKLTISDNDLFKVLRMCEANNVAVRFPFLDHRFVDFSATVPAKVKMRGRQLRSFFKNAYEELLPLDIRTKTKHGFGLPIPAWLRTDQQLNSMMMDLVLSSQSLQRGFFRRDTLQKFVDAHRTDETSFYGAILWNLMVLELWFRK